jgi:UDP-N-acetylmuramoylalanine--D-glutamate ligase
VDNFIKNLKNKNIHVVGASGTEGSAILEFLVKNGINKITAHDFSAGKEELRRNFLKTHLWLKGKEKIASYEEFLRHTINLKLKDKYLDGVLNADIIFVPSSWYLYQPNFPLLEDAKKKGIEFSSLTKLYFALAKGKIISVTGTKGKGTTSKLIYEILSKAGEGKKVYLAGNDRRSAQELDKVSKMKKGDILVLETSNRQLMVDLDKSPDIGVITNLSPDHIDEHGSFEKYIEVKKSLFSYAKKDNVAVLNYDNEITNNFGGELIGKNIKVFFFSRKCRIENGAYLNNRKIFIKIETGEYIICNVEDIKLLGEHNTENVLAAVLSAYLAGAKPEEIKKAIQEFHGLPHRIEFIGEHSGVKFYDDLASTNPDSTIAAIRSLKPLASQSVGYKLILIAGGDDKGMNYEGLIRETVDKVDSIILLPGTGSEIIKRQILNDDRHKNIFFECSDFQEALERIKEQTKTGDIVLISPASAHFQARYIDVLKKPIRNLIVEKFR